jgi:AraC-like DNA-binding protein
LAAFVAGLWAGISPGAFSRHRTLPNGELTLMFHLGPAQRLTEVDGRSCNSVLGGGFVAGLQERPATYETVATQTCVAAARLLPLGGWLLLGRIPQADLVGRVVEIEDLLGGRSGVGALRQRMGEARDLGEALDRLERWLLDRFAAARSPHPVVLAAGTLLRGARGSLRVERLADDTGLSARRLRELFLREMGVPPKRMARILRFRAALERLATAPGVDLTRLALDCGYYDEAHLYRDFRDLATMTPLDYLAALHHGLDGPDVLTG